MTLDNDGRICRMARRVPQPDIGLRRLRHRPRTSYCGNRAAYQGSHDMKCISSIKQSLILACTVGLVSMLAFKAAAQAIDEPSAHLVPVSPTQAAGDEANSSDRVEDSTADGAVVAAENKAGTMRCKRQTGSSIRPRTCDEVRGRTHDRDDLDATGRKDVGTQVQALDTDSHVYNRLNDG